MPTAPSMRAQVTTHHRASPLLPSIQLEIPRHYQLLPPPPPPPPLRDQQYYHDYSILLLLPLLSYGIFSYNLDAHLITFDE